MADVERQRVKLIEVWRRADVEIFNSVHANQKRDTVMME